MLAVGHQPYFFEFHYIISIVTMECIPLLFWFPLALSVFQKIALLIF